MKNIQLLKHYQPISIELMSPFGFSEFLMLFIKIFIVLNWLQAWIKSLSHRTSYYDDRASAYLIMIIHDIHILTIFTLAIRLVITHITAPVSRELKYSLSHKFTNAGSPIVIIHYNQTPNRMSKKIRERVGLSNRNYANY